MSEHDGFLYLWDWRLTVARSGVADQPTMRRGGWPECISDWICSESPLSEL